MIDFAEFEENGIMLFDPELEEDTIKALRHLLDRKEAGDKRYWLCILAEGYGQPIWDNHEYIIFHIYTPTMHIRLEEQGYDNQNFYITYTEYRPTGKEVKGELYLKKEEVIKTLRTLLGDVSLDWEEIANEMGVKEVESDAD